MSRFTVLSSPDTTFHSLRVGSGDETKDFARACKISATPTFDSISDYTTLRILFQYHRNTGAR